MVKVLSRTTARIWSGFSEPATLEYGNSEHSHHDKNLEQAIMQFSKSEYHKKLTIIDSTKSFRETIYIKMRLKRRVRIVPQVFI
ncbi:hypothetical protein BGZ67_010528, partial [Mortierella alpina]